MTNTCFTIDMGGGKSQVMIEEEKAPTLTTTHYGEPAVIIVNDQGGNIIDVTEDNIAPCLRAESHQHEPVVCVFDSYNMPVCYPEKRFFDWEQDDTSVTIRNKGGSYGGAASASLWKRHGRMICTDVIGTLDTEYRKVTSNQIVANNQLVVETNDTNV